MVISEFQGEYRWLSNFIPNGNGFSVEHHYQAAKTLDPVEQRKILDAKTPAIAKNLGRKLEKAGKVRADWNDVTKLKVMEDLIFKKFATCHIFREKLLSTGNAELIEGNTWGDVFWGVCKGVGQNHLGKILMRVRAQLRIGL